MLFQYAIEATQENWLHDTLFELLCKGMDQLDAGDDLSAWPICLPASRRAALSAKTGLRTRLKAFFDQYAVLELDGRQSVRSAILAQNDLPAIFDGLSLRVCLSDLPEDIREPTKELFSFAFKLLTPLGLRDQHYTKIYQELPYKLCPFCGLERLNPPEQPRHDLDHYLLIKVYPFAGTNFRNLVPMCDRCNKGFKGQIDVIFDKATEARRMCFDPYVGPGIEVSLERTVLLDDDLQIASPTNWSIDFLGNEVERTSTWDGVFRTRRRYSDELTDKYTGWLHHFGTWAADPRSGIEITNAAEAITTLNHYLEVILEEGSDYGQFLRHAVFRMLRQKCANDPGSRNHVDWLKGFVSQLKNT